MLQIPPGATEEAQSLHLNFPFLFSTVKALSLLVTQKSPLSNVMTLNRVRIIAMQVVLVNRFLQEKRTASLILCCLDSCRHVIPDLGLSLFTQIFVRASSGITLGCQYLSSCTLAQNGTRSFRTLLSKIHCFAAGQLDDLFSREL